MELVKPDSFYNLNPDVLALIIEYLNDPRDLIALWNSNKWLFHSIMPRCVKYLFMDPSSLIYLPNFALERFDRLRSIRCDLKVLYSSDIYYYITNNPLCTEFCFHLKLCGPSMLSTISILLYNDLLTSKYFRLEKWVVELSCYDHVWIGKGKLSHINVDSAYQYIAMYRDYLTHLLVDPVVFSDMEYVEIISELDHLTQITLLDYGYSPYKSEYMCNAIKSNDRLESITTISCEYYYDVDKSHKFEEIDLFVENLKSDGETYNKIRELVLPISLNDILSLSDIFPSLKNVGIRWVFPVNNIDIIYDVSELQNIYNMYNQLTVFIYIDYITVTVRQNINRHPELKQTIMSELTKTLKTAYPDIVLIDTSTSLPTHMLAIDNWLFSTLF